MADEDLLVTNAFYPIATLTEQGNNQSVSVKYNYPQKVVQPYKTEPIGPFPNVRFEDSSSFTDKKTANDFRSYLKKKKGDADPDFRLNTNADFLDTSMEKGNLPTFYEDREKRVQKYKKYMINIDSRMRNWPGSPIYNPNETEYPSASHYVIQLAQPIQNVKVVTMVSSEIPFTEDQYVNSYIYVCCKQLSNFMAFPSFGGTAPIENIFSKVQLNGYVGEYTFNCQTRSVKVFDTPLRELRELEFSFYYPDGTVYPFETTYINDNGATIERDFNHSMTLEITSYVDLMPNTEISSIRGVQDTTNIDIQPY